MSYELSSFSEPIRNRMERKIMDGNGHMSHWSEVFEAMDLDALKEMRKTINRAISGYETRKRKEALSALEQAAKEHGFKLSDLVADQKPGKGRRYSEAEAEAAYVNPENPDETWSGRGRRPRWVNDALAAGRALEELKAQS